MLLETVTFDPTSIFTSTTYVGAALFVLWKLANRMISAWRDTAKERNAMEMERLKQQHAEQMKLADAIECLSDRVHENTQTMERFIVGITPSEGTRVVRVG